jgi:hypothetical protein
VNSAMIEPYQTIVSYRVLRDELLDVISDANLAYSPGGGAETLGVLCRQLGETEHNYTRSFETFKRDLSYHNADPELERSVAALKAWYAELDRELEAVLEGLTDDDLANRRIDYGDVKRGVFSEFAGFEPGLLPPGLHLDVFREALLIFYGKVSVYLKALNLPRPQEWRDWIG